jgi:hypothetical protein
MPCNDDENPPNSPPIFPAFPVIGRHRDSCPITEGLTNPLWPTRRARECARSKRGVSRIYLVHGRIGDIIGLGIRSNGGNAKEGRNEVGGRGYFARRVLWRWSPPHARRTLRWRRHPIPAPRINQHVTRFHCGKVGLAWGRVVENSPVVDAAGYPSSCLALLATAIQGQLEVCLSSRNREKTGTK